MYHRDGHSDLPSYRLSARVKAAEIVHHTNTSVTVKVNGEKRMYRVPENFYARYIPLFGDMLVFHEDGRMTIEPRRSFDVDYSPEAN